MIEKRRTQESVEKIKIYIKKIKLSTLIIK
jgi:hypothetical protein